MTQRNRADQDVRAGGVFVRCPEKKGLSRFGFSGQGDNSEVRGEYVSQREECNSQDQRMAVWPILNEIWKSKMESPVDISS